MDFRNDNEASTCDDKDARERERLLREVGVSGGGDEDEGEDEVMDLC